MLLVCKVLFLKTILAHNSLIILFSLLSPYFLSNWLIKPILISIFMGYMWTPEKYEYLDFYNLYGIYEHIQIMNMWLAVDLL